MVKRALLKLLITNVVVIFIVGATGFASADLTDGTVEDRRVYADVSAPIPKNDNKVTFIDTITIGSSLVIPFLVFIWWLINIYQDKKNMEHGARQDLEVDLKLDKVITNQHSWCIDHQDRLNKEFDKIHAKIESLSQQVSTAQIESLRNFYDHSGKINVLINEVGNINSMRRDLVEIENYLSLRHQYKVRTSSRTNSDVE